MNDLDRLASSLRRIVRALRSTSTEAEKRVGITGAQLYVLQQLTAHPGASLSELAALTFTDLSSVSVVVSRLVARRLVSRRAAQADRRRVELTPTAKGRALLTRAPRTAQTRLFAALGSVPTRDLGAAARALEAVARALDGAGGPPPMFFEPPSRKRS
jgi:DNA-binding MarR family transcriptional regulator